VLLTVRNQTGNYLLKARFHNCGVVALILLLSLKGGFSVYVTDKPLWVFSIQHIANPVIPSAEGEAVTVYSIPPNITLTFSERSIQYSLSESHNKYNPDGVHFSCMHLYHISREYIRYADIIKPSLGSTCLIYPFHSYF